MIWGTVTDARGRALPNARIRVNGTTFAGQKAFFEAESDASGRYSLRNVPEGHYRVEGKIQPTYQGMTWLLPLHPTDDSQNQVSPTEGVNKNFQWKLSGPMPRADITDAGSYYGGAVLIQAQNRSGIQLSFPWDPFGGVAFVFTAIGSLIDGSTGQKLTLTRNIAALNTSTSIGRVAVENTSTLHDIPLGTYEVTAALYTPYQWARGESPERTLQLATVGQGFRTSVTISFRPSMTATNGIEAVLPTPTIYVWTD